MEGDPHRLQPLHRQWSPVEIINNPITYQY
jgi:hypothetical protein